MRAGPRPRAVTGPSRRPRAAGSRSRSIVSRRRAPRTHDQPARLENVLAILPGTRSDAVARPSSSSPATSTRCPRDVMDPAADAPGADDDASGVAVVDRVRAAALGQAPIAPRSSSRRVSGEEQGLLGGQAARSSYLRRRDTTIGGFLDNDIVGADSAPGGPHRVRVFSGGGPDGVDSPSRDLARAVEEIAGRGRGPPGLPPRPPGPGRRPPAVRRGRASGGPLHRAARELRPRASDAARRERPRVRRPDPLPRLRVSRPASRASTPRVLGRLA